MVETLKDKAEYVESEFDTLRVLVDAVDDKLRFFIVEKSLWGGCADLVRSFAFDIQTLLHVMNDYIWQLEKAQGEVVRGLHRNPNIKTVCSGEEAANHE